MTNQFYHLVDIREGFKPKKKWAVFLDRDGVINEEKHLVHKIKDFIIYPSAFKAISLLNKYNIPTIVHNNGSVVTRGICPLEQVVKVNEYMKRKLAQKNAFVDLILFCPHHPTAYNPRMVYDCFWRKPKPGMIGFAAKLLNINLQKSYVVGDAARDLLMAKKTGTKGILVQTGHAGKDKVYKAKAEIIVKDVLEAVNYIIRDKRL